MKRLCSECGSPLNERAPRAKTCGDKCRKERSRRIRAAKAAGGESTALPSHQKLAQEIVRGERDDVVRDVVREEVRPVVRDALTEDVLRGIQDLIALTPAAIAAIRDDLASDDVNIRAKAYSLVAKYTFGHPAIVRPPEETEGKELHVYFGLPRPGAEAEVVALDHPETDEIQPCDRCGEDKPLSDFVAGSQRCLSCFEEQQEEAKNLFDDTHEG